MNFNEYLELNSRVAGSIPSQVLNEFLSGLARVRDSGRTLWIAGNGGSSSTASHAVVDFVKTATSFGSNPLRSSALSEMISLQTALANDIAFEDAFAASVDFLAEPGDAVLILSVSGTSPNLLRLVESAKNQNLAVFAVTGTKGKDLCTNADFGICLESEDYQIVENLHLLLIHWFTKQLGNE